MAGRSPRELLLSRWLALAGKQPKYQRGLDQKRQGETEDKIHGFAPELGMKNPEEYPGYDDQTDQHSHGLETTKQD